MKWGVLDTQDNVWLGDETGPKTFDDEILARVAAQVTDVQMGWAPGRCRAREYHGDATQLRDTVKTKMTPHAALKAIESGRKL
jgi:hypothetical protein